MGSMNATSPLVLLIIANIYVLAENYETALKILHSVDSTQLLERFAFSEFDKNQTQNNRFYK
jgi:uncharacterized protein HemY